MSGPSNPKPSRDVRRKIDADLYDHVYEPAWVGNVDYGKRCRVLGANGYMRTIEFINEKRTTCNADAVHMLKAGER